MQIIKDPQLKKLIEATIFMNKEPTSIDELVKGVLEPYEVKSRKVKSIIVQLTNDYLDRGINLIESASGFSFQTALEINEPLSKIWEDKAARYSKAALETLALIAYKQPITKGEIEEIRGVGVSHPIIRQFVDRGWIRSMGHKDVPGRPTMYGTTKIFLDDLNLKTLDELPELEEKTLQDLSNKAVQFDLSLTEENDDSNPPNTAEDQ